MSDIDMNFGLKIAKTVFSGIERRNCKSQKASCYRSASVIL